jgi:CubicO group peptidase (beta-lactamase class C family)
MPSRASASFSTLAEAGTDAALRILTRAVADRVFPAAVGEVGQSTGRLWRSSVGRLTFDDDAAPATEDTIFDLASLTKPLATTTLALELVARGRLRLNEPLVNAFPEWRGADRVGVTVADLLEHASGLPARLLDRPPQGRREFEHEICSIPLEYLPQTKSVYSDLNFILLGFLLSDRDGRPMREQFANLVGRLQAIGGEGDFRSSPKGEAIDFGPIDAGPHSIAPTVPLDDDSRRGLRLSGEVHDDYASLLGGAAGHAGLFGNVAGVGRWARAMLRALRGEPGFPSLLPRDLVLRAVRRSEVPGSSRALGWDTMLLSSSCGNRMSATAFGHVGFTGTSLWIDPESDRYFVLLTNRACEGGTLAQMRDVRRAFHDALAARR